MAVKPESDLGVNSWLEDELYQQYLHDRGAVDESWKQVFEDGGTGKTAAPVPPGDIVRREPAPAEAEVLSP